MGQGAQTKRASGEIPVIFCKADVILLIVFFLIQLLYVQYLF